MKRKKKKGFAKVEDRGIAISLTDSSLINGHTVISRPGAAIRVERIDIADSLRQRLTTTATSLSGIILRTAKKTDDTSAPIAEIAEV